MTLTIKTRYCLLLTALFVLDACVPQSGSTSHPRYASVRPEDLLEASSELNMAEEDEANLSPMEQHLRARSRVDPTKLDGSAAYTTKGHVPSEETHFRVVRLTAAEKQQKAKAKAESKQAPVVVAEAAPVPSEKPARVIAQPVSGGSASVTGVRIGDHPGKTRLVFDLSGPSGYSYKIDNEGRTLRIELPGTGWGIDSQKTFAGNKLLKSYSIEQLQAGGSLVVIQLKGAAKLLSSVALKPNETYGHRIYFDIAPS